MPDQPFTAIDVVPVQVADELHVGTAVRVNEPFAGEAALPGVLLGSGELLADAVLRALRDKAGVDGIDVRHVLQLGAFDRPGRDPRSHAISIAFLAVLDPGAGQNMEWSPVTELPRGLPFDHDSIVDTAVEAMRTRLWQDEKLTRALTGPMFPFTLAQSVQEQLTGVRPNQSSLRRNLLNNPSIERLDDVAPVPRGRPATMWRWVG